MSEIVLKGIPAAPGIVVGKAYIFGREELDVEKVAIFEDQVPLEISRFEDALIQTRQEIIVLQKKIADRKVVVEDSVGEGDRVAMRFAISGTHTGTFMGIPATGKPIHVTASGIFRVVDGKATDNWVNFDALGLLQQIGAVPMPK